MIQKKHFMPNLSRKTCSEQWKVFKGIVAKIINCYVLVEKVPISENTNANSSDEQHNYHELRIAKEHNYSRLLVDSHSS
jgi:hypothetical protein